MGFQLVPKSVSLNIFHNALYGDIRNKNHHINSDTETNLLVDFYAVMQKKMTANSVRIFANLTAFFSNQLVGT